MKQPDFELLHNVKHEAERSASRISDDALRVRFEIMLRRAEEKADAHIEHFVRDCVEEIADISSTIDCILALSEEEPAA